MKRIYRIIAFMMIINVLYPLRIKNPGGGFIREKAFDLEIEDLPELMKFNYNGVSFLAKGSGVFSRRIIGARGWNTITVSDFKNLNVSDTINVYADVAPTAVKVILFWDTDNTDLDLHIVEPDGTECNYRNPRTPLGGSLDVDVTSGYGPEIYTMENPNSGTYEIYVHFYGGAELTEAGVAVILFEGTQREARYNFSLMLTRSGDKVFIGKFDVR
jgi:uncharacterized protein YfaP (DUF2135 family)